MNLVGLAGVRVLAAEPTVKKAKALLADYNALEPRHDGDDYRHYTDVKAEFVRGVLARIDRRSP